MNVKKKPVKNRQLKADLQKELHFVKNLFKMFSLPLQKKGDNDNQMDIEVTNKTKQDEEKQLPKRAHSILELEEKLEKIKSESNYNLKTKLAKKSLTSKLNKKIKKRERVKLNKHKVHAALESSEVKETKIKQKEKNVNTAKPIFNSEGKLVFSKFDFAKLGERDTSNKSQKDPKKILDNLKQQEEKLQKLAEVDSEKAKELKEKAAWKNILQKAEGEKVKDDTTLLKKSIKKMEQKKKVSQKKWEGRIQNVEKKKEERQNKRKENISKKKKEKKAKVVKAAVKRGRVVI
ncbi:surfeit locus protein 6 homolog [Maniola hyperantus]|uniref:surfeit locus protein 6 homolog n=1 Tax=Aphantopus hyperantus TaxID=2795564 RepID=UPI00156867B6|nr:surfeit locus protein 6 homolog [Maniola hyperantus]XP_034840983.1 surfeit locus protein 6 homolog [Maniola hyperantus]